VLEYDADGHLIRDEENRTLEYDPLGRLVSVSDPSGGGDTGYSYDPLDTLAGLDDGSGKEQRFYQDGELTSQVKGANSSSFLRADGVVLAEHQVGADPKSLLLAGDNKNSVLWEINQDATQEVVYTPYGHRMDEASVSSHLGYNGERREAQTGWYLLGQGYRAFNPVLMRFHSPDSWSPFGEGGVNAYAYCLGDPVSFTDPTGHVGVIPSFRIPRPKLITALALPGRAGSNGSPMSTSIQPSKRPVESGSVADLAKSRIVRPKNQNFETGNIADLAQRRRASSNTRKSSRELTPIPESKAQQARPQQTGSAAEAVKQQAIDFNRATYNGEYNQLLKYSAPGRKVGVTASGTSIFTTENYHYNPQFGIKVYETRADQVRWTGGRKTRFSDMYD
jgi:RHS repeat-associated protein